MKHFFVFERGLGVCGFDSKKKTCWAAFCPRLRAVEKISNDTGIM